MSFLNWLKMFESLGKVKNIVKMFWKFWLVIICMGFISLILLVYEFLFRN